VASVVAGEMPARVLVRQTTCGTTATSGVSDRTCGQEGRQGRQQRRVMATVGWWGEPENPGESALPWTTCGTTATIGVSEGVGGARSVWCVCACVLERT